MRYLTLYDRWKEYFVKLRLSFNLRHPIIALLVRGELLDRKPATTGERLINSHRKLREGRKTRRERDERAKRGKFRIHTVRMIYDTRYRRGRIRYNINNYRRFGRMQSRLRL